MAFEQILDSRASGFTRIYYSGKYTGGVDKEGKDAVNDLTYVMLRATELMRLRDPNLNARYYNGINSPEYLKRLCEVNVTTGATPAIHNDKAVIKALTGKGDAIEHARDYGVIGCVEPCSSGSELWRFPCKQKEVTIMGLNLDLWSKKIIDEIYGEVTDEFLELLLKGMDLAFFFSSGYRRNIDGFMRR